MQYRLSAASLAMLRSHTLLCKRLDYLSRRVHRAAQLHYRQDARIRELERQVYLHTKDTYHPPPA